MRSIIQQCTNRDNKISMESGTDDNTIEFMRLVSYNSRANFTRLNSFFVAIVHLLGLYHHVTFANGHIVIGLRTKRHIDGK